MITLVVVLTGLLTVQDSVLAREPKLKDTVELRSEAGSIGEFLTQVTAKTGVKLKASPTVRDDRLVLFALGPAHDTLERIAKHFDWTWEIDTDGTLTLTQTQAQRISEAKAREEQALIPLLRWQAEARKSLQSNVATEKDKEAFRLFVQRVMKHREGYNPVAMEKEEHSRWLQADVEINNERVRYIRLFNPANQAADAFAASLSRADLLRLDRDGKIVGAYYPGVILNPLLSNAQTQMGLLADRLSSLPTNADGLSPEAQTELDLLKLRLPLNAFKADEIRNGLIEVRTEGPLHPLDPSGKIPQQVILIDRQGRPLYEERISSRSYKEETPLPKVVAQHPVLEARIDPSETLTGILQSWIESRTLLSRFRSSTTKVHPSAQLARLLVEIASSAKVNLVADCLDTEVWSASPKLPITMLRHAMEAFCIHAQADWDFDGAWISARTKYWQALRPQSVPTETLCKIRDLLAAAPAQLNAFADAAALVTYRQSRGAIASTLFASASRKGVAAYTLEFQYPHTFHFLRFLGMLSPAVRRQLLEGSTLSYGSLPPDQKEAIRLFLLHFSVQHWPMMGYSSDPASPDMRLLAQVWPDFDPKEATKAGPMELLKNGVPGGLSISLHRSPAVAYEVRAGGSSAGHVATENMLRMFALSEQYRQDYRLGQRDTMEVRSAQMDRYTFTLRPSARETIGMQLQFGQPGSGSFTPYSQLPEEFRKKLEGEGG
ncbi:MAG: hypothetical protein KF784_07700 [Fimbriimonadaceae bacterium]|nr:hypothetical protein [Fimbriimonadaceae bacterium]